MAVEDKRHRNPGRPAGASNITTYKWKVVKFDKEKNKFVEGKFRSIKDLNETWDLKWNADYVKRIMTGYRADQNQRNGENSFYSRWGNYNITKIKEKI